MATSETTHYDLMLYGSDGVPAFRNDWDATMNKIDSAIYAASQSGGSTSGLSYESAKPNGSYDEGTLGKLLLDLEAFMGGAASTYLTKTDASSTYLTKTDASSTYLTQSTAASTYATTAQLEGYLTTTTAGQTYVHL